VGIGGAQSADTEDAASAKGIKSGWISSSPAATFNIDSSDDSIHAGDSTLITGGTLNLSSEMTASTATLR
jgi:hypothetical protein